MQDSLSFRAESLFTPLKFKVCKTTALSIMPSVLKMPFFFFFFCHKTIISCAGANI